MKLTKEEKKIIRKFLLKQRAFYYKHGYLETGNNRYNTSSDSSINIQFVLDALITILNSEATTEGRKHKYLIFR